MIFTQHTKQVSAVFLQKRIYIYRIFKIFFPGQRFNLTSAFWLTTTTYFSFFVLINFKNCDTNFVLSNHVVAWYIFFEVFSRKMYSVYRYISIFHSKNLKFQVIFSSLLKFENLYIQMIHLNEIVYLSNT